MRQTVSITMRTMITALLVFGFIMSGSTTLSSYHRESTSGEQRKESPSKKGKKDVEKDKKGEKKNIANKISPRDIPFSDYIEGPLPRVLKKGLTSDTIPDANTPMKYIKVNLHFMLDDEGYGHFTETSSGCSSPSTFNPDDLEDCSPDAVDYLGRVEYNGYWYAEELIGMANYRLSTNVQMNLPPGNSTPVLDPKYRYVLHGVYFHKNSQYCVFPSSSSVLMSQYGVDVGNAINVFLCQVDPSVSYGGYANMSGSRRVVMQKFWAAYLCNPTVNFGLWVKAGTLNHEIGHNLSLLHTMRQNNGPCSWTFDDYCSDTPTRQEMYDLTGQDPCCGWGGGSNWWCTNNLMDYSGSHALSPEQLGRVHHALENELVNYWSVSYSTFKINGHMNSTVIVMPGEDIILDGSKAHTNDNKYFISVQKSDKWWNRYGLEHMRWLTPAEVSDIGNFDVRAFCNGYLNLETGNFYRVKLAVKPWHSKTILVYISGAPIDQIPVMTTNQSPYGVADSSSFFNSDYHAWKAFDGNDQGAPGWTMWISEYPGAGQPFPESWLSYEFEIPTYISSA